MFWIIGASLVVIYLLLDWLIRQLKVDNYCNKFVFITGCDSGFGRDLAIRLDKMGFPVFAGCLTQDGRTSLEETCSSRLVTLSLNVTNKDSIREAFETVKQKLRNDTCLWAVVNNAGVIGRSGAAEMCFHEDYVSACSVNLFGAIEVSRVFMPLLRKSKGRLVIITSIMSRCPCASGPYSVSKSGLAAFGDVIRREVSRFGVKVSMLEPGLFRTDIMNPDRIKNTIEDGYNMADPDVQEAYGKNYVNWASAIINKSETLCSSDTYKVVDVYVAAITSVYPRPRYLVGNDAKYFLAPLSLMPEWITDWVLTSLQGRLPENK